MSETQPMPHEMGSTSSETRLQRLLLKQHQVLGVYVTFRCPLECAHCGVDSHPRRTERIEQDFLLEQVQMAADGGTISSLHINGGEPFLERRLLKELAQLASRLDLGLVVTTSAHWATSIERARQALEHLSSLTQLMISADTYHLPFVPLENVSNAARASVEMGAITQVSVCTPKGEADDFFESVRKELGSDLLTQVEVLLAPLDPVGRAEQLPEAHWRPIVDEFPAEPCRQLNRPILLPDGTVSACCNTLVTARKPGANPLKLGNCRERDLNELLSEADESYYVQAIRAGGPALLARIACRYGAGEHFEGRYRQGDICQLCDEILHNPSIQAALRKGLAQPEVRREIAFLRASMFQEFDMLTEMIEPKTKTQNDTERSQP